MAFSTNNFEILIQCCQNVNAIFVYQHSKLYYTYIIWNKITFLKYKKSKIYIHFITCFGWILQWSKTYLNSFSAVFSVET